MGLQQVDFILIDHWKNLYMPDFKLLESYGIIKKGTVVVGDNMINPGAPDYLEHFKTREDYDSVLYWAHVEYTTAPDAVMVS